MGTAKHLLLLMDVGFYVFMEFAKLKIRQGFLEYLCLSFLYACIEREDPEF